MNRAGFRLGWGRVRQATGKKALIQVSEIF